MNTVLKRILSLFIGAVLAFGFFAPSAAAAASAVGSNADSSAVMEDASRVNDAALGVSVPSATAAARTSAVSEYPTLPSKSEIAAMSKFDGRDYGIVTPVKDQGSTNLCWAYSSVAASESSILISKTDPTATPESKPDGGCIPYDEQDIGSVEQHKRRICHRGFYCGNGKSRKDCDVVFTVVGTGKLKQRTGRSV